MKYRKKPVVIEAWKFTRESYYKELAKYHTKDVIYDLWIGDNDTAYCYVHTLEGQMLATEGDYIIKGVQGEIYPCKPDIFEATYEAVDEDDEPKSSKTLEEVYFERNPGAKRLEYREADCPCPSDYGLDKSNMCPKIDGKNLTCKQCWSREWKGGNE
ncbi:MAG: hypothetical protein VB031_02315 [Eubacteriaceae bacterium]|nr:hypothetical protein [Eubacteriaceae bacterium]